MTQDSSSQTVTAITCVLNKSLDAQCELVPILDHSLPHVHLAICKLRKFIQIIPKDSPKSKTL
jgi:hypothetical protein